MTWVDHRIKERAPENEVSEKDFTEIPPMHGPCEECEGKKEISEFPRCIRCGKIYDDSLDREYPMDRDCE